MSKFRIVMFMPHMNKWYYATETSKAEASHTCLLWEYKFGYLSYWEHK